MHGKGGLSAIAGNEVTACREGSSGNDGVPALPAMQCRTTITLLTALESGEISDLEQGVFLQEEGI